MLVDYGTAGRIATIALNRPEKRNALTTAMILALRDALDRAARDEAVRAILLRGAGADFCAGLSSTASRGGRCSSFVAKPPTESTIRPASVSRMFDSM